MDIPLLIAILALLTWTLLPQLDRYADADYRAKASLHLSNTWRAGSTTEPGRAAAAILNQTGSLREASSDAPVRQRRPSLSAESCAASLPRPGCRGIRVSQGPRCRAWRFLASDNQPFSMRRTSSMREFIDGATAIARGAIDAGATFFAGYPISPATPILLHMIRELPKVGGIAIQGEDEIASISMCVAAAMTGARAFTATSGPGMSLYSETIGLASWAKSRSSSSTCSGSAPPPAARRRPARATCSLRAGATRAATRSSRSRPAPSTSATASLESRSTWPSGSAAPSSCSPTKSFSRRSLRSKSTARDAAGPGASGRRALPAGAPGLRAEETFIPYRLAAPDAVPEYAPIGGPHIVRFTGSTHDEHGFLTKDPVEGRPAERASAPQNRGPCGRARHVVRVGRPSARPRLHLLRHHDRRHGGSLPLLLRQGPAVSMLQCRPSGRRPRSRSWSRPARRRRAAGPPGRGGRVEQRRFSPGGRAGRLSLGGREPLIPPEIVGINRVDGELITPAQFLAEVV